MNPTIINLIIQLVSGAVGGNIAGGLLKSLNLGPVGNSIAGIVGGGLGGQILSNDDACRRGERESGRGRGWHRVPRRAGAGRGGRGGGGGGGGGVCAPDDGRGERAVVNHTPRKQGAENSRGVTGDPVAPRTFLTELTGIKVGSHRCSSAARSSRDSLTLAASAFSSRCSIERVPGMGSITGERARSHASATCVTASRAAMRCTRATRRARCRVLLRGDR